MNPKIPVFVTRQFGGARGFRRYHRAALRDLRRAYEKARRGCAYVPGYYDLQAIEELLDAAIEKSRPANWRQGTGICTKCGGSGRIWDNGDRVACDECQS